MYIFETLHKKDIYMALGVFDLPDHVMWQLVYFLDSDSIVKCFRTTRASQRGQLSLAWCGSLRLTLLLTHMMQVGRFMLPHTMRRMRLLQPLLECEREHEIPYIQPLLVPLFSGCATGSSEHWISAMRLVEPHVDSAVLLQYYRCSYANLVLLRRELDQGYGTIEIALKDVEAIVPRDILHRFRSSWHRIFVTVMEPLEKLRYSVIERARVAMAALGPLCSMLKCLVYANPSVAPAMLPSRLNETKRMHRRLNFISRNLRRGVLLFR